MPIYEYVCETCGNEFEIMRKFSDPELKSHDCAPKAKVHRKLSLTAFHLQGGGWYASGYGNGSSGKNGSGGKSESPSAKGESGAAGKGESGAAGKSESGAAGKSESGGPAKNESSGPAKSEAGGAGKSETKVAAAGGCAGGCACH